LEGLDELKQFLDPLLTAHLKSVIIHGAQARYDGERGVRRVGKPYPSVQGEHIEEMFTKLWKDVREGRIFLSAAEEFMSDVMACCLARVPKLLPNREISDEGRYVLNLKPTNAGSGKERHPVADTPKHADVVRAVIIKQLLWPRVKIMMSKRDIEGAFKRIFRAIKDIDLFATDLPFTWVMESIFEEWKRKDSIRWCPEEIEVWKELRETFGSKLNDLKELKALVAFVTAFNLSLEFGSSAAPGEFRQFAKAAEVATQKSGCARIDIDGPGGFTMFTWVDDGIGVEAFLGLRPFIAIRVYEDHVRTALGADAIQLEKMAEEGETAEQVRAWGIDIDSANRKQTLPSKKMEAMYFMVNQDCFTWGCKRVLRKTDQQRCGLLQWGRNVCKPLGVEMASFHDMQKRDQQSYYLQPVGDEEEVEERWERFWLSSEAVRVMVGMSEMWETRFTSTLSAALTAEERLSMPGEAEKARFLTGDATPEEAAAIDWKDKVVVLSKTKWLYPALRRLVPGATEEIVIAIAELVAYLLIVS